jgi:hypothetical protein
VEVASDSPGQRDAGLKLEIGDLNGRDDDGPVEAGDHPVPGVDEAEHHAGERRESEAGEADATKTKSDQIQPPPWRKAKA